MKLELSNLDGITSFEPDKEFIRVLTSEDTTLCLGEFSDLIIAILKADAKRILPPNTPFEIRGARPGNFGRERSYYWIYSPPKEKSLKWEIDSELGCFKAGRFLT